MIGVLPRDFGLAGFFPRFEVWAPLPAGGAPSRGDRSLLVFGLLRPGATPEHARAELDALSRRLAESHPETDAGRGAKLLPLREEMLDEGTGLVVALLVATVGFVLVIACANVANLMLARATTRRHELALRAALGAGRWRIVRELLGESLLVGLAGGAVGVVLSLWGVDVLAGLLPAGTAEQSRPDLHVLAFTLVLSFLAALLFGLAPALRGRKIDVGEALKEGGARTAGPARGRLQSGLVVAQVGLALVALVGAGLAIRGFGRLQRIEPGFDPRHLLTLELDPSHARYPADRDVADLYARVIERLAGAGGVLAAAAVSPLPVVGGEPSVSATIEGVPARAGTDERPWLSPVSMSPGYLDALGIPLLAGRAVGVGDAPGAPDVAVGIVAHAAAQRTREIGVRVALGARRTDVLRLMLGKGLAPVALGVACGLAGAAAVTRGMSSQLYGLSPVDPATFAGVVALLFAGVVALLFAVAALASWLPALRAARVDPMQALRNE